MRLFSGKITPIADEIVRSLIEGGSIEAESDEEVRLDVEAVLKEYLRLDRDIVDEAKSRMETRGLGYANLGRVKAQVAKERGAPPSDEVLPYLLDQILKMLFHSANVDEIFCRRRRPPEDDHPGAEAPYGRRGGTRQGSALEDQEPQRGNGKLRNRVRASHGADEAKARPHVGVVSRGVLHQDPSARALRHQRWPVIHPTVSFPHGTPHCFGHTVGFRSCWAAHDWASQHDRFRTRLGHRRGRIAGGRASFGQPSILRCAPPTASRPVRAWAVIGNGGARPTSAGSRRHRCSTGES